MQWNEIIVHTCTEAQELVSDVLINCGADGTSILDRSYIPDITKPGTEWELYDANLLENMPLDVEIHAWFNVEQPITKLLNNIIEKLSILKQINTSIPFGTLNVEYKLADDNEWKDKWKEYFKPLHIGNHIVIKPSWEQYEKKDSDIIIELDPGMAFGSGTHATTYMCIELLEKHIKSESTIIDIGTGSGILAIAAALLGAKNVLGLDINYDAVQVAKENVIKNNLSNKITILQSDLLSSVNGKYDIAVANIIADAVIMLTPDVINVLNKDAIYIVSGILQERENDVIKKAISCGFKTIEVLHRDEWCAVAFRYKHA